MVTDSGKLREAAKAVEELVAKEEMETVLVSTPLEESVEDSLHELSTAAFEAKYKIKRKTASVVVPAIDAYDLPVLPGESGTELLETVAASDPDLGTLQRRLVKYESGDVEFPVDEFAELARALALATRALDTSGAGEDLDESLKDIRAASVEVRSALSETES